MGTKSDMTKKLKTVTEFYEALDTPACYCQQKKIIWVNSSAEKFKDVLSEFVDCLPQRDEELREVTYKDNKYQLRFRKFDDGFFVEILEISELLLTDFLSSVTSLTDMTAFLSRTASNHIFNSLSPVRMILEKTEQYRGLRYLDEINTENYKLFRFSSLLQEYYNLENSEQLVYQQVDFAREIGFLMSAVSLHTMRGKVPFYYDIPKTAVIGYGDINRLNIALLQIISNAFYFTSPNNEVRVNMIAEEEEILFEVMDKGAGISPDLMDKVFCPFFSYDPNTGDVAGSGLGLSYAALLAKKYGGSCTITSSKRGSCVRLRYPITGIDALDRKFKNAEVYNKQFDYSLSELAPVRVYLSNLLQLDE